MKLAELKIDSYSERISEFETTQIKGGNTGIVGGTQAARVTRDTTSQYRGCTADVQVTQDSSGCYVIKTTITCIE